MMDGYFVRLIKATAFLQHDPEMFALYACGAIATAGATVLGLELRQSPCTQR